MKQFTVIYNEKNPRIAQIALQIIKNLKAQKFILKINDFKNSDFVVVLGGDGTVLKAVAMMSENNNKLLPILPVSLGRLGFLAEIHPHHLVPTLKRIMQQQKFILDKRALLDVYLRGSSGTGKNKTWLKNKWYAGLIAGLRKCQVQADDFHHKNWGIRPTTGDLVLLDLGF
jgi:NAD kinase